jgi:hypothetical protein
MNLQFIKFAGRAFTVGLIVVLVFGYYVFTQVCTNTVVAEMRSPGNGWRVVIFERSCGSFTGNSTQISILKPEEALQNDAGNIYVAEGYPKGYSAQWLSDSAVAVSGTKGTIHRQLETFEGITISYEGAADAE